MYIVRKVALISCIGLSFHSLQFDGYSIRRLFRVVLVSSFLLSNLPPFLTCIEFESTYPRDASFAYPEPRPSVNTGPEDQSARPLRD